MASNGSRKRRHKSKEKVQGVNTQSDSSSQDNQQKLKQQKQQTEQQQQQQQQQQPQQQPQQQQQPQPLLQQQPQSENTECPKAKTAPVQKCVCTRLYLSRSADTVTAGIGDDNLTDKDACSITATPPRGHGSRDQSMTGDLSDLPGHPNTGCTALLIAVSWKQHTMVEMLLRKGADVAEVSETGQNSLMMAAHSGDVAMLSLLLSYRRPSLDINAADKDGNTALHHSTVSASQEAVAFLLEHGASPDVTNNAGKSPLHIAATQGLVGICEQLIKHLAPTTESRAAVAQGILREDAEGRTPICEALSNEQLAVVKILMEACSPQETLEFYMKNIQKLTRAAVEHPDTDVQAILASLLFVVKRLQKDYLREVAEVAPMEHLVHIVRHCITSPRVLSTACLLISVLIWTDSMTDDSTSPALHGPEFEYSELSDIQAVLIQQFLDCKGPEAVMEKLSTQMFTAHDTYLMVSTLLPIMILASRTPGRTWLEQNSGNLSFYKELLTRNKAFITHISLSNQPGLQVGHVIKTFLSFVEETEAKDREQNLAQLLEEEERDRLKRERKKRKRQKKQSKHAKTEAPLVADIDASSDEESGECASWATDGCRDADMFSHLTQVSAGKDQPHLFYTPQQEGLQEEQQMQSKGAYAMLTDSNLAVSTPGKAFPADACIGADKFTGHDVKWCQSVSLPDDFPPISTGSDERTCSDGGEGWVKVEGRKPCVKTSSRQSPSSVVLRPIKRQEVTRNQPMRWADVAKIGCYRDSFCKDVTVLLNNAARFPASDYYKKSVLSGNSANKTAPELGDCRSLVQEDGDVWQQIARNAFVDNMASKQIDDDQELVLHSSASSDSESDALSSTLSSECPSGQSDGLQGRKKNSSAADGFDRMEPAVGKDGAMDKSDHYTYRSAFSNYRGEPREINSFIFEEANLLDDKKPGLLEDSGKHAFTKKSLAEEEVHNSKEMLKETAWSRAEAKPAMAFSHVWGLTSRVETSEALDSPRESSPVLGTDLHDDELPAPSFPRSKMSASSVVDAEDSAVANLQLRTLYCPHPYYDPQPEAYFRNIKDQNVKCRPPYAASFQKDLENPQEPTSQWGFNKRQMAEYSHDQQSWFTRDAKLADGKTSTGWEDMMPVDCSFAPQPQTVNCFMPSFSSMSSAVDNNPIVTSVVESVLTPNVISLSNLPNQNKPPTYSSKISEIPSPPPGFKFSNPNPIRVSNFDHSFVMLNNQAALTNKSSNPGLSTAVSNQDIPKQTSTFSNNDSFNFDSHRQTDKQLLFASLGSRSVVAATAGPFSQTLAGSEESLMLQQQQQQQQQRQQHYFHSVSGAIFNPLVALTGGIVQAVSGMDNRQQSSVLAAYDLPLNAPQMMQGDGGPESWADRFRSISLATTSTPASLPQSLYASSTPGTCPGSFTTVLSSRLQQRQSLRHQDSQQAQLKRLQQQYQDIQLKSFHEAVENCQRRYSEQVLTQQQRHQQIYTPLLQHSFRLSMKQNNPAGIPSQMKQPLSLQQHHSRMQQQRLPSPPVLFPSDLRDEPDSHPGEKADSPVFQDMTGSDLLSDLFADPLLVERIAIRQIRQQVLASHANSVMRDTAMSALRDSVYCNDLEYYASLYRLKLKDLLLCASQTDNSDSPDRACGLVGRADLDKTRISCSRSHMTPDGRCMSPKRESGVDRFSRRWRDALNKILDTAWTMRRQFGDIVLPNSLSEFNISQVCSPTQSTNIQFITDGSGSQPEAQQPRMEYPLVLGFTTDGCEVAVLILEKSQAYIDPYLLDIMCDPELDHHFILRCKGMSETCSSEYIALDLCDYTLAEYMQIVQLSHRQDPLSANRLAWQLLEGLKFIHHNLSMPHGNLKPSWVFVDSEGRLRLAGYGIVTAVSGPSPGGRRSSSDRSDRDRSICWTATEDLNKDQCQPSMASDIQVAGMLLYFILTGGQHPFGSTPMEAEMNMARNTNQMDLISDEANDLVSGMLFPDPTARPTIEHCLKHPFFWSGEKKFRLILIVGSDVLTEMKTGIALTGNGSPTMTEILSVLDISDVSPNWVQAINPTIMKEMRSFRVYKNSLSELTLFIYNCCLHFDKMSPIAKEVLDDPCKYFQTLFPSLFMSIYRSLKASDRTDRTCYKPFFS